MIDLTVLPAFIATILMFLAPPGPDMLLMITIGLQGGRAAAVKAIAGIGTGMLMYAIAVVLGLDVLTRRFPYLLTALELVGAAYLLRLAWMSARHDHEGDNSNSQTHASQRWYRRGLTVSLTNPKIFLFFVAVLPQFAGDATSLPAQLALLGALNTALEVALYGTVGVFAGQSREWFLRRPRASMLLHRLAAVVYVTLASLIAISAIQK